MQEVHEVSSDNIAIFSAIFGPLLQFPCMKRQGI